MQSVMQMIVMPVQGITQGTQPIMSYNYGAGNYARVRRTFQRLLTVTLTATCSAFLAVILFPGLLARIFTPQEETIQLVSQVMPLFFGGIWAFGAQMACQITFMSLGQARTSLFLALLRKVILLVPLALLLPRITGSVFGIFAAEPIADTLPVPRPSPCSCASANRFFPYPAAKLLYNEQPPAGDAENTSPAGAHLFSVRTPYAVRLTPPVPPSGGSR